jgi:triosephosphate isomerase
VLGESDELVNLKVRAVLEGGLECILCCGETLDQRMKSQTDAVNERQVVAGLAGVTGEQLRRVTIAYEPVWAIGTGKVATPYDAQTAHERIRAVVTRLYGNELASNIRIQYGGSLKPSNATELFTAEDVDGGLIGGASLKGDEFTAICKAAAEAKSGHRK